MYLHWFNRLSVFIIFAYLINDLLSDRRLVNMDTLVFVILIFLFTDESTERYLFRSLAR